jgi:hypothetical protein
MASRLKRHLLPRQRPQLGVKLQYQVFLILTLALLQAVQYARDVLHRSTGLPVKKVARYQMPIIANEPEEGMKALGRGVLSFDALIPILSCHGNTK